MNQASSAAVKGTCWTEMRGNIGRAVDRDYTGATRSLFTYASRVAEIFPLRKCPDDEMHLRAPTVRVASCHTENK